MSEVAHNADHEFWRPPVQAQRIQEGGAGRTMVEVCDRCGTEFVVGARFCHVCGALRESHVPGPARRLSRIFEFHNIKQALGLSTASLVAFIIGLGCVLAAVLTGIIFTADTVLDWQAVQMWRVEWMLAAIASFLAGILLKQPAK